MPVVRRFIGGFLRKGALSSSAAAVSNPRRCVESAVSVCERFTPPDLALCWSQYGTHATSLRTALAAPLTGGL